VRKEPSLPTATDYAALHCGCRLFSKPALCFHWESNPELLSQSPPGGDFGRELSLNLPDVCSFRHSYRYSIAVAVLPRSEGGRRSSTELLLGDDQPCHSATRFGGKALNLDLPLRSRWLRPIKRDVTRSTTEPGELRPPHLPFCAGRAGSTHRSPFCRFPTAGQFPGVDRPPDTRFMHEGKPLPLMAMNYAALHCLTDQRRTHTRRYESFFDPSCDDQRSLLTTCSGQEFMV
jgi:hypothetical protein